MKVAPKGPAATRWKKRKRQMLARLRIPPDALPGSLALTHRRCGKPTCHCATGSGHPVWSLTFMVDGHKRVERIPEAWVDFVREQVDSGRQFKEVLQELFAANAELLVLWRKEQGQ